MAVGQPVSSLADELLADSARARQNVLAGIGVGLASIAFYNPGPRGVGG